MLPFPSATSTNWDFPGSPRDLNLSNRPVRTRMPGGVAGEPRDMLTTPYADFSTNKVCASARDIGFGSRLKLAANPA
jgi:hypothetical protein